jgi:DNA-directed RNA polymerase subunit alpha
MMRPGRWKNLTEKELDLLKTIIISRRTWDSERVVAFADTIMDCYGICLPDVPTEDEKLRMPISALCNSMHFTVRLHNILRAENIHTVGDILKHSESGLLRLPNMGRRSVNDLKACLDEIGLSLRSH